MNESYAFEIGLTLCFQVLVVVAATRGLQVWIDDARSSCRLWTVCFLSILGLMVAAILLPHRRMFAFHESFSPDALVKIITWQTWLVVALAMVWSTGLAILLLRRGIQYSGLLRFLRERCEDITPGQLMAPNQGDAPTVPELLASDKRLMRLQLMVSKDIRGPFCWQLHRPVIVLPQYLLREDQTVLRHVLGHEMEHLRSQHPMQHFLQGFCSIVFWFHPVVWWAARNAELTREFTCDEVVAVADGKIANYLRTLAKIAEKCTDSHSRSPSGTLAFGNQKSSLIRRSDRLVNLALNPRRKRPFRSWVAFTSLLLIAFAANQVWLPTNVIASTRSDWSPWPRWTARTLYHFDVRVRDYEPFDERSQMHELLERRTTK